MRVVACLGIDAAEPNGGLLPGEAASSQLPAMLNEELGGRPEGHFDFDLPAEARERAEALRDFHRALSAGGVALLTPSHFEEVWRPGGAAGGGAERAGGDVSAEAANAAVAAFREQLFEVLTAPMAPSPAAAAAADIGGGGGGAAGEAAGGSRSSSAPPAACEAEEDEALAAAIASGAVEANLSVGAAMRFVEHVGLTPRILQPRFVVVLAPGSLRVATLGFVGEPLLGDRPTEKRTPFVVRLLTQNLACASSERPLTRLRVNYWVRLSGPLETSISPVLSTEVPGLLDITVGRADSFANRPLDIPPQALLFAGIAIPAEGVQEREDVTLFTIEVRPSDGAVPWTVSRRYQQFHLLYSGLRPTVSNRLAAMSFPRKHLRACSGERLEARRRGLEMWLSEAVREAQSREPGWLPALREFLDFDAADPAGRQ